MRLFDALQGEMTANHYFVLDEIMRHIDEIEARNARLGARLLDELNDESLTDFAANSARRRSGQRPYVARNRRRH